MTSGRTKPPKALQSARRKQIQLSKNLQKQKRLCIRMNKGKKG